MAMLNDQKVNPNACPLNHHLLTCVQNFLVFKVYGFLYNPCERHQFTRMNHRPRVWLNPSIVTSSNEPCNCSELLSKCGILENNLSKTGIGFVLHLSIFNSL